MTTTAKERPPVRSGWCHKAAEAWSHERCYKPGCPCACHLAAVPLAANVEPLRWDGDDA